MTGFDRRTQEAMNQTRREHSTHLELLESRQKQQRELAAKAIEAEHEKTRRLEKQRKYDNSVGKIISTASLKSETSSLSRRQIQEAATDIATDDRSTQMDKNIAGIYQTLPGYLQAETLLRKSYLPDDQYEKLRLNRVLFNESLRCSAVSCVIHYHRTPRMFSDAIDASSRLARRSITVTASSR